MSRLLVSSDLHLGDDRVINFRTQFCTAEEHHELVYENLRTSVKRRDTLLLLGDIAFNEKWLQKVQDIPCERKILILGNHDTEMLPLASLACAYDDVHALFRRSGIWYSHAPIHSDHLRSRNIKGLIKSYLNVHGHTHNLHVDDDRYFNACVENTDYKPVSLDSIRSVFSARGIF